MQLRKSRNYKERWRSKYSYKDVLLFRAARSTPGRRQALRPVHRRPL